MIRTRWIDIGATAPQQFHDLYRNAAAAQPRDAEPIIFWGKPAPHICLGAHQSRNAELDPACPYPVARRWLGGGTVWLDPRQYCFIIVVPATGWGRPADWFDRGLAPMMDAYRHFGLSVERHGRDVWLGNSKIAGSGAATIGPSALLGSSFMLDFDAGSFTEAIACPSCQYRSVLRKALAGAMTSWRQHATPPPESEIRSAFRRYISARLGWTIYDDKLSSSESVAADDMTEDDLGSAKAVANGIKINDATFLLEATFSEAVLTLLSARRTLADIVLPGVVSPALAGRMAGLSFNEPILRSTLEQELSAKQAAVWTRRILALAGEVS